MTPPPGDSKLSNEGLHRRFLEALGDAVISHSEIEKKPLEVDLKCSLPPRLRVYMYNATYPPGGRTMGEHKIQLIVPGQRRGDCGNFDSSNGRIPLLVGYRSDLRIFILWDADLYVDFSYSRNVQVKPETVYEAFAQGIGRERRKLKGNLKESVKGNERRNFLTHNEELVINADAAHLRQAVLERQQETLKRLLER